MTNFTAYCFVFVIVIAYTGFIAWGVITAFDILKWAFRSLVTYRGLSKIVPITVIIVMLFLMFIVLNKTGFKL